MARILIVDDDKDILRLMQFSLEKAGYQVELASSGPEGLEIVRANPPQVIIADVMMPEMTGYDFTRAVRAMPGLENLPIIIYSARFQAVDKQAALDAGATDYLPKTVLPPDIIKRIRELLGDETAAGKTSGQLIGFFSLRGGVGVTTLATNIAVALALSRKIPIGLSDLNPVAGHAGLMLGLRPRRHIYNILQNPQPLSEALIRQQLTAHKSGVQLLASPLISPETPGKHTIEAVVSEMGNLFPFTLIDLPHAFTPSLNGLLNNLGKLVLVLSPDVPSLQSAAVAMQMLTRRGFDMERVVPVLNRPTPVPGLAVQTIQKTLRRPLAAEIPFEAHAVTALNSGKPLVLYASQSAAATAIARLAVTLMK